MDSIENEIGSGLESDSGDSVFLTQIPQSSIPNAAISPYLSARSTPVSPRSLESGSSSSSSSSNENEGVPERRNRHLLLPDYNFPFLNQRKSQLSDNRYARAARNRAIHYVSMAGFFSCVGEMWPNGQRRESFESTLPMVDADNEEITPITEDDESDEEDVKIIDKRLFVYSLKPKITKSSQPWFKSLRNKVAETTKPTRKSISQQHFGTERTSQSTSNKPEDLSKEIQEHLDSSSDETFIEESITSRSPAIYAHNDTVNLAQVNQVTDHGTVLSALDELEDSESQSILQNHSLDIRGRDHSICNANEVLSTKTKQGDVILEDKNENLSRSLSQESADLFEDYITNYSSPHRRKDKTPRKNNRNNLITENNGNTVEKCNDVECDLESTSLTKLMSASCNQKKNVKGQSLPEDAESCTNAVGTVQKKKKIDLENAEKEQNETNLDPLQLVNNLEKEAKEQSLPEDAELLSCQNVEDNDDGTVQKKKKGDVETAEKEQYFTNLGLQMNNGQSDNMAVVEKTVSNLSDNKRKHKKKQKEARDCDDEGFSLKEFQLLKMDKNASSGLAERQEISDLVSNDQTGTDCLSIQGDEPVSVRKKRKKPVLSAEKEQNLTNLDPSLIVNNGQSENMTVVDQTVSNMSEDGRKLKKKQKSTFDCYALKEFPLQNTDKNSSSSLVENREISSVVNSDNTVTEGDEPVSVRKKKRKKRTVQSAEKEQNGTSLDPSLIVNNGQPENMTVVDQTVSNLSDKRKHKKKRKEVCNEDLALNEPPLYNTDKNSSSGLVRNREKSELVHNDDADTDSISTQGHDSESGIKKKKKKKRKVHSMAETVQNVTPDLSLSGEGLGADGLDVSTNTSRSLSQESVDLFEDYITNYSSPHRRKDKTPGKNNRNNLITENNGNTVEKCNDVECDLECTSLTKLMSASCNQKKNVKGQNLPEDAESCTNGVGTVQKKKKFDLENAEKEQNETNLDPLQLVNNLEKEAKEQSLPEDAKLLSCQNVEDNDDGTVQKKKKTRKKKGDVETAEKEQYFTNLGLQMNNGQSDNMAVVEKTVSNLSDNKRKHKKKQKEARDCDDEGFSLKEFQLLKMDKNASSGLAARQEISDLVSNDQTGTDCLSIQGDEPVSVRKKRKKPVLSAEKEQNLTNLDPSLIVNNGQSENMTVVDQTVSNLSDNKRKHKKKRKDVCNEDLALNEPPLYNTDKNSSSGLVRNREKSELVHNDDADTDSISTQGHDSESGIKKKKKKKRKVHSMAETVQNVTPDLSLSGEGHGADGLDISTNIIESAENITFSQQTELSNKVKKEKKRKKNRDGELNKLDPNVKVTEIPEMDGCNESTDYDSTEVNEGYHVKKKKKKTSRGESCQTGMGKTTPEGGMGSVILSPKASECPERIKGDKKKRRLCDVESVTVETSGVTELEQSTVKRKKHKTCFKEHERTVPSPSHVEISPSSGKPQKSARTKVKKRLYNHRDNFFDTT